MLSWISCGRFRNGTFDLKDSEETGGLMHLGKTNRNNKAKRFLSTTRYGKPCGTNRYHLADVPNHHLIYNFIYKNFACPLVKQLWTDLHCLRL